VALSQEATQQASGMISSHHSNGSESCLKILKLQQNLKKTLKNQKPFKNPQNPNPKTYLKDPQKTLHG
jgi:hypothetical protein